MNEQIRFKKFLIDLDQILQENVDIYMDEYGNPIENDITEQDVYNWIMENKQYRLLTSEKAKHIIHLFMSDFSFRMNMLRTLNLL